MKFFSTVRSRLRVANLVPRILPGCFVMVVVLSAQVFGLLEPLELIAFDTFLTLRPPEPPDNRITLIKITQADIERWGGYPIPNHKIVELVEQLQVHKPEVIGLNLLDDLLPEEKQEAISLFQKYDNLVIAEKILPPQILAPSNINHSKIGFVDVDTDRDKYLRRIILGTANPVNVDDLSDFKFSFTIRLADKFLTSYGYSLENGLKNIDAMRYDNVEIPLIEKNYGGYVGIDAGGIQTFINYRQNKTPFNEIHIQDILENEFSSIFVANRILIIGVTDPTTRHVIKTPLSRYSNLRSTTGVDIQGHAVSQIISAVMDSRVLLRSWRNSYDYLWVFTWGIIFSISSAMKNEEERQYKFLILFNFMTFFTCYFLSLSGIWISYSPILIFTIIVIFFNLTKRLYIIEKEKNEAQRKEEEIQKESELRKETIERIFSIIHNGPLQTLSGVIRDARTNNLDLISNLERLDKEIRRVGDISKDNSSDFQHQFYFGNNRKIDLRLPMHELFYQLFSETIERDLSGFKCLKVKIRSFDPIKPEDCVLTIEEKRGLCRFLEEMLCNVEKHAVGASLVKAIGKMCHQSKNYILRIEDNGAILNRTQPGEGTKHALNLEEVLNGTFSRFRSPSNKTCCELKWSIDKRTRKKQ